MTVSGDSGEFHVLESSFSGDYVALFSKKASLKTSLGNILVKLCTICYCHH